MSSDPRKITLTLDNRFSLSGAGRCTEVSNVRSPSRVVAQQRSARKSHLMYQVALARTEFPMSSNPFTDLGNANSFILELCKNMSKSVLKILSL